MAVDSLNRPDRFCRRMALDGRLPEFKNGCYVEAKHENVVAERPTASEKLDRRVWVAMRPSALRIHRRKAVSEVPIP